jgi:hypothetical protein
VDFSAQAVKQVLASVSDIKDLQVITSPDGVPAIRAEVEVSIPILAPSDFKAGAVLREESFDLRDPCQSDYQFLGFHFRGLPSAEFGADSI